MNLNKIVITKTQQIFIVALALSMTAACTTAPNVVEDQALTPTKVDSNQVCQTNCDKDEEGVNRYQYYLGILSVFLMG